MPERKLWVMGIFFILFYIFEVSIKDVYFIFLKHLKQEVNGSPSTKDIDYLKLPVLTFTGLTDMIISKLVHHVLELHCTVIS